jgi:hypothetical protein
LEAALKGDFAPGLRVAPGQAGMLDHGDAPVQRHQEPEHRCGFNIVPMWHPLRLAEDYAMADILTGGRAGGRTVEKVEHPALRLLLLPWPLTAVVSLVLTRGSTTCRIVGGDLPNLVSDAVLGFEELQVLIVLPAPLI